MKQYHPIQLEILQKLMYSNGLHFAQIQPKEMEGSRFTFHLDKLIAEKLISKDEGVYKLTDTGKELANRMDIGDKAVKTQAKISVIMVCIRKTDSDSEYLLYDRKKNPFFGYQGFPTGKVKRGENVVAAAKRELKEETNLEGSPILNSIRHYRIFSPENILLEDRLFFVYRIDDPIGTLKSNNEGEFHWISQQKIWEYLEKPVNEVFEIIENINNPELSFKELEYTAEGF